MTQEDMHCSDELWKKSHLNPKANPSDIPPMCTWKDLINLHKEPESDGTTLTNLARSIHCMEISLGLVHPWSHIFSPILISIETAQTY